MKSAAVTLSPCLPKFLIQIEIGQPILFTDPENWFTFFVILKLRACVFIKKNNDLLLWWLQLRVMANSNEAPFDKIGNLENYSRQTRHRMESDQKDKR